MAVSFWQDGQGREQKRIEFGASLFARCSRYFTSANTHRPVLQSSSRRPTVDDTTRMMPPSGLWTWSRATRMKWTEH